MCIHKPHHLYFMEQEAYCRTCQKMPGDGSLHVTHLKPPTFLSLYLLPSLTQGTTSSSESWDGTWAGLFAESWGTSGKTAPNASRSDAPVVSNHTAIHQPGSVMQCVRGYTSGLGGLRLPIDSDPQILDKALQRCWEVNVRYIHQDVHKSLLVPFKTEFKGKKHKLHVAVNLYRSDPDIWGTNWMEFI